MLRTLISILLIMVMLFEITGVMLQKHVCMMEQSESITAIDGVETEHQDSDCSCMDADKANPLATAGSALDEASCCFNYSSYLHFDYKSEFRAKNAVTYVPVVAVSGFFDRDEALVNTLAAFPATFPNFHSPPLSGADFIIAVHQIKIPDHC